MTDESGVTLGMILTHMRAMEVRLTRRIDSIDQRLTQRIDGVDHGLTARIDRLERNLTRQIDAIDKRLDAVEIEMLPKRVRAIETVVYGK